MAIRRIELPPEVAASRSENCLFESEMAAPRKLTESSRFRNGISGFERSNERRFWAISHSRSLISECTIIIIAVLEALVTFCAHTQGRSCHDILSVEADTTVARERGRFLP